MIALIAVIYSVVGAVNKWQGTSVSATGVVAGAFAVLGAHIINTFVIPVWNFIAALVNFFYNVWNDPVAAVKILFLDLANSVIGYMLNMAKTIESIINKIPGVHVDITSGLDSFKSRIEDTAAKVKSEAEWKEIVQAKDFIDYGAAAKAGYDFGAKAEGKIKNVFSGKGLDFGGGAGGVPAQDVWEDIAGNTGGTAGNTARMADSMDLAEEDLQSMRDMAEQEVINRFTTAELTVNMGGITNQVNSGMDLDGISSYLEESIFEVLETAAEGVY